MTANSKKNLAINNKNDIKPPKCSYPACLYQNNQVTTSPDDVLFKCCHYCYTFYCSRECRRLDWLDHKNYNCLYGRLSSHCKKLLMKVGRNRDLRIELSKIASSSYNSTSQRGFVWLDFGSESDALTFLDKPINLIEPSNFLFYFAQHLIPKYVCFNKMDKKNMDDTESFLLNCGDSNSVSNNNRNNNDIVLSQLFFNYFQNYSKQKNNSSKLKDEEFESFNALCNSYNPLKEFLLLISIKLDHEEKHKTLLSNNIPRRAQHINQNSLYVLKFIKVPLIDKINSYSGEKKLSTGNSDNVDLPLTLILTSLNQHQSKIQSSNNIKKGTNEEDRQLFLANLLNEFEMRGINLRLKYPAIYRDLCFYVSDNKPFTPICLFPRDLNTNSLFMCLIMPNSEPAYYSWLYDVNKLIKKSNHFESNDLNNDNTTLASPDLSQYLCIL